MSGSENFAGAQIHHPFTLHDAFAQHLRVSLGGHHEINIGRSRCIGRAHVGVVGGENIEPGQHRVNEL